MSSVIQMQPKKGVSETTALLKSPTSVSLASSIRTVCSLPELSLVSSLSTFRINRHEKRPCCNFSRNYQVLGGERNELLLTAFQENGLCSCANFNDDYDDMIIYDLNDQVMFSIEFEEITGYLSKQMKFSVVSSTKIGLGTVSRILHFMESPRYEIQSWSGEHLFSIGRPTTSGIRSYDYKLKYDVISNDGIAVANVVQVGRTVTLKFCKKQLLSNKNKTLILSLGFILDLLRNEEI